MIRGRSLLPRLRWLGFALVLAVLFASLRSYKLIPAWGARDPGLDLLNVYDFHHCAGHDDPYLVSGATCGDPLGRAMPYPPLMYWLQGWLRWVSFPRAWRLWSVFILLSLLWAAVVWSGDGAELRLRARAKFDRAGRMFFTRSGLEQASAEVVARHRARRFDTAGPVADLCCGIGGDLIALAERHPVLAVDIDPLHLRMAQDAHRGVRYVYGLIANPFKVAIDAGNGQKKAEIGGHRRLQSQ